MSDRRPEPELNALFEAQRHEDARDAPPFAELMARARVESESAAESDNAADAATAGESAGASSTRLPRLHVRWRREWAGLAAAAVIAAVIMIPRMRSEDDSFEQAVRAFQNDPALGAWESPTDGLLNLPGDRLLYTIPDVGMETR